MKKIATNQKSFSILFVIMSLLISINVYAQKKLLKTSRPGTLGLADGFLNYSTPKLTLQLVKESQTVSKLEPVGSKGFDFVPHEWLKQRAGNGYYHLGDINLRIRTVGTKKWISYSSAKNRKPVTSVPISRNSVLAAADLHNTFPKNLPLDIVRYWQKKGSNLILRFVIKNITNHKIEIGALGMPVIFDNDFTGKPIEKTSNENVFYDPYIGEDAGYLQVTRLNGRGPVLLVLPWKKSPFEAYRPLLNDPTRRGIGFEGFYEWMTNSKAYAENEWKNARPWNVPTSKILKPNEVYSVGLKFVLADSVENINKTLIKHNMPVAVGIPGYVIPMGTDAELFLKTKEKVKKIFVDPINSMKFKYVSTTPKGWKKYEIQGLKWGRSRLTIVYADSRIQTISYKIIKPESQVVADNGNFLFSHQWYQNPHDLFGRSPSIISYDYGAKRQITQEGRVWIAGLSDEAGAGSWLNAIMKEFIAPDPAQIAKLENFVNKTLWGGIQYNHGKYKYGVRKSMFYYQPDSMPPGTYSDTINYKTWSAWSEKQAKSVGRSFNYTHVAAAYWVMYRLSRYYKGLVRQKNWSWYLNNAYHTVMAMVRFAPYYARFGQMEGTVFFMILRDLKAEGWYSQENKLEAAMKKRAIYWDSLEFPYGSEMSWDSTGQEEVYLWENYFGFSSKALETIKAILNYMPTVPSWAYNGCARRYWDFLYAGKLMRIERMIHHYGSGLNAIPVLSYYRKHPNNLYTLRVGYGGLMGAISNITKDGFGPVAFHAFPSALKIDDYSGDYGCGFFGYAINTATYIVNDKNFGWIAFGGNLNVKGNWIKTKITTAAKSRIYITPSKTWLTLDAGQFKTVDYNPKDGVIKLTLEQGNYFTPNAYIHVQDSNIKYQISGFSKMVRGAYVVPLKSKAIEIELIPENK